MDKSTPQIAGVKTLTVRAFQADHMLVNSISLSRDVVFSLIQNWGEIPESPWTNTYLTSQTPKLSSMEEKKGRDEKTNSLSGLIIHKKL